MQYYKHTLDVYFEPNTSEKELTPILEQKVTWKQYSDISEVLRSVLNKNGFISRKFLIGSSDALSTLTPKSISLEPVVKTENFLRYYVTTNLKTSNFYGTFEIAINAQTLENMKQDNYGKLERLCDGLQLEYLITQNFGLYPQLASNSMKRSPENLQSSSSSSSSSSSGDYLIKLFGLESQLIIAQPSLKSLCDIYKGCAAHCLDLSSFYDSALFGSPSFADIEKICEFYNVHIYMPVLKPSSTGETTNEPLSRKVFVTSTIKENCLVVVDLLQKRLDAFARQKKFVTAVQSTKHGVSGGKLDFIKKYYSTALEKLMIKFGCFIDVRSESDSVIFYSCNNVLMKTAVREFSNNILSRVYEFSFQCRDSSQEQAVVEFFMSQNLDINVYHDLEKHAFHIICDAFEVLLPKMLQEPLFDREHIINICFLFELLPEFQDFITGKKFGKLNKIEEESNAKLSLLFEQTTSVPLVKVKQMELEHDGEHVSNASFSNTDTIYVEVQDDSSLESVFKAVQLMHMEIPFEKSIFIPESFHKAIIGNGGKLIQSIMRRHNVFIQFSNTHCYPQSDFSFIRFDNVLIRCPYKNRNTIADAENELFELEKKILQNMEIPMSIDKRAELTERKDSGLSVTRENESLVLWEFDLCELESMMMSMKSGQREGLRIQDVIGKLEEKNDVYIQFPEYDEYSFALEATRNVRGENDIDDQSLENSVDGKVCVIIKGKNVDEGVLECVKNDQLAAVYLPKKYQFELGSVESLVESTVQLLKSLLFYEYDCNIKYLKERNSFMIYYYDEQNLEFAKAYLQQNLSVSLAK
ncbi:hypothetical protein ACO0QE_003155 [Hanseniaspora vineae]